MPDHKERNKMINWDEVKSKAGGNIKQYVVDGEYSVKCDDVEIKEVGTNGSVVMKFHFEDGEKGAYPTADHWLSFKNDAWRQWHNKCLMVVLGATEENAKKAVEVCEGKSGKENQVKAYEATYKRLLAKKPTVDIEVFTEGKYARAEFLDRSVAMPHGNEDQPKEIVNDYVPVDEDASAEGDVDLSSMPF